MPLATSYRCPTSGWCSARCGVTATWGSIIPTNKEWLITTIFEKFWRSKYSDIQILNLYIRNVARHVATRCGYFFVPTFASGKVGRLYPQNISNINSFFYYGTRNKQEGIWDAGETATAVSLDDGTGGTRKTTKIFIKRQLEYLYLKDNLDNFGQL